jgi:hypothetical protein
MTRLNLLAAVGGALALKDRCRRAAQSVGGRYAQGGRDLKLDRAGAWLPALVPAGPGCALERSRSPASARRTGPHAGSVLTSWPRRAAVRVVDHLDAVVGGDNRFG